MIITISICLFTAYILCFVYLYNKNTEYLCFILLLVLNILLLLLSFSQKEVYKMMTIIPYNIFGWDGKIPLRIIFLITWSLLLVANSILINTFRILHSKYSEYGKEIDLGDPKNYNLKDNLKISMICSTILLWGLLFFPSNEDRMMMALSIIALTTSSISVYLSQQLGNNTKTISTPSKK